MRVFSSHTDYAINSMNSSLNSLGINPRTLSENKTNIFKAITAVYSRIMDIEFAKEQSNAIRLQILQKNCYCSVVSSQYWTSSHA